MAVTRTMGYQFLTEEALGEHDLNATDTILICLMKTTFTFNPATHSTYADISADEIATGYGYTQKTKVLTTGVTETATGATVSSNNPSWTASGGDLPAVGSAIVINDSHTNDTVICCIDFGADYTTADGTVFQIDFTNGLFTKANS